MKCDRDSSAGKVSRPANTEQFETAWCSSCCQSRVEKKAGKKYVKSKRENSDSSSSQKGFSREVLQVWGEGSLEEGLPRSCDAAPFADWKI